MALPDKKEVLEALQDDVIMQYVFAKTLSDPVVKKSLQMEVAKFYSNGLSEQERFLKKILRVANKKDLIKD